MEINQEDDFHVNILCGDEALGDLIYLYILVHFTFCWGRLYISVD